MDQAAANQKMLMSQFNKDGLKEKGMRNAWHNTIYMHITLECEWGKQKRTENDSLMATCDLLMRKTINSERRKFLGVFSMESATDKDAV